MTQKHDNSHDIIVIGGGMAGLSLSLALQNKGHKVACIDMADPEAQTSAEFDGRTVAISAGSAQVLQSAGVWPPLLREACPIEKIEILDGGGPALLDFLAVDVRAESFGWIIENRFVRQTLFDAAREAESLDHIAPAQVAAFRQLDNHVAVSLSDGTVLTGKLLVGADGRNSWVREQAGIRTRGWTYNQRAVICTVQHENPHRHIAVEDFRPEGPFAILPMNNDETGANRSSIVWTEHGPQRRSAMHSNEETFNLALNARFPDFYGDVKRISPAQSYPLGLIHAERYTDHRLVLVADAAHAIHPIAGQGLNIGLRDVKELVSLTGRQPDPGAPEVLKSFTRRRQIDNMGMIFATDSLNKLFSHDFPPVRLARRMGLKAVRRLPPARRFFMKQAMGRADSSRG